MDGKDIGNLIVWTSGGTIVVALLDKKGIGLKSIHESIDKTSSSGKLIFHIFGALAEFERNLIQERTHTGLKAACARGKMAGRPEKFNSEKAKLSHDIGAF